MSEIGHPWVVAAAKEGRWLVGVSGGVDSMALLHVLARAGFSELVVCHLNHGLRGEDADGDADFVREVAEGLGYEFRGEKVDLRGQMEVSGESLESAGRTARYDFFARCSEEFRGEGVVLGHHADDQAETVLWNLMRGSAGCRGMEEEAEISVGEMRLRVVRPLLRVRKVELRSWLEVRGLGWREDASNAVNDVVRNRLRNEVFPLMDEVARRDVRPFLSRAGATDREMREALRWALEKAAVYDAQGRLHVGVLRELPVFLQREAIKDFLSRAGVLRVDHELLARCVEVMDVGGGASVNLPGGRQLRRKEGRLFVR